MADVSKITLPDGSEYNIKDANAQQKILVSGILEGDGEGGVSASDIMDYDTDTASGAVVSFTADSIAPLKSLLVSIEPVQDLHGYENPWPAGGGTNKFVMADATGTTIGNYGLTIDVDANAETARIYGTPTWSDLSKKSFRFVSVQQNGPYGNAPATHDYSGYSFKGFIVKSDSKVSDVTNVGYDSSGGTMTITISINALGDIDFTVKIAAYEGSTAPTAWTPYSNNCPISGWSAVNVWVKPSYDPTANPTATIQLGQTTYGATLDVTQGKMVVDRAIVDMGTLHYYKSTSTSASGGSVFAVRIEEVGNGMASRDRYSPNTMLCSLFATADDSIWWVNTLPDMSMMVNLDILYIADSQYSTTSTFKTAMSGVQLVYKLATPIEIPLTPTQIFTLQGQINNLWVDTGDIMVEYRNGENALLRDVAEAVENLQGKIQVNGLLKSNGNGEVFLAEPGTDYATPSQIPTVPSASTATPQMDGAPSPGSTGQWSDGGHTHPTDTTRAAAALEINGHSLTGDFDLTAADVGALASNGTARSSYTLFPTKVYPGTLAAGWYKFAEVNITATTGRAKITFKYGLSNVNYDFIGDIFVYKTNSTTMNCSMQIPYSVSGKITYFRYNIDSANTVSFYVYKHNEYGNPVFTFITSEDINGNYLEPSTYMLESLVAGTPPATALKPIYSAINRWVYNVPVSPGTNEQILSCSLGMITSASVLAKIEFANPGYIKSDCSWETTDGANPNDNGTITLTGTCTAATTANLLILNVLPD